MHTPMSKRPSRSRGRRSSWPNGGSASATGLNSPRSAMRPAMHGRSRPPIVRRGNAGMHSRVSLFGLTVESEIPLPAPAAGAGPADVTIRFGTVPHLLDGARISRPRFDADDRSVLLRVDRVARFLVRDA